MPFDNSATPTTATNSATYLVKRRLRILVGCGAAAGAASAAREASSARPCGASGCSEMLIPAKLARRNPLVSCRNAERTKTNRGKTCRCRRLGGLFLQIGLPLPPGGQRIRLLKLFQRDADGRRPALGSNPCFQQRAAWSDSLLFNEYFHGDTGEG